jgi:GWxTD domain-containing protein
MKRILLYIFLLCTGINLHAKIVEFNVEGALFRYNDDKVLWEMYYTFPDTLLNYKIKDSLYTGELYIKVKILSSVRTESEKEWIVTNSSRLPIVEHKMDLLGQKDFLLLPGQYTVEINVYDMYDTTTHADTKFNLLVRKFGKNSIELSDIELAKTIEQSSVVSEQLSVDNGQSSIVSEKWNRAFKKNGLYVVPNPTLIYEGNTPIINAYFEVYNAKSFAPDGYMLNYKIFDAAKREEISLDKTVKSESDAQGETVSLPVNVLPTGVYYLSLTISFPINEPVDSVTAIERFYILNPEIPPKLVTNFFENATFEKSEFAAMSEEQINNEFNKAKPIASPNEIELWKELTTKDAKQRFMYSFWYSRNTDTTMPYNKKLMEYRELISYATTYFSFGKNREGWRTDRGKVLLKYGQPTQRDQYPAKGDDRPYETWFYSNVQGGVTFNFVDLLGFGNFILVNSNATGELRNDNWHNQYVPAHGSNDSQQNSQGK